MEHGADWRPIEAAPPSAGTSAAASTTEGGQQLVRAIALGVVACAALAALAVVLWLTTPRPELVLPAADASSSAAATASVPGEGSAELAVVVDIGGAVSAPGLYTLPGGSRVGDAIAAAGGYAANADLETAALLLNLAARLNDGDKVLVPRLGAAVPSRVPDPAAGTAAPVAMLIDLNTADEAALDTLPGIGPVTAAKIIAARAEAPFSSVDELLARGVVGAATLDKIRSLVTVGP